MATTIKKVEYKQQNNNEVESPNTRGMCRPRFECAHCKYSSTWRHLLIAHLKSHSVDRQKRCGVCGRSFKTAASLRDHRKIHTGVKPHSCKECDHHFITKGQLNRHIKYKHTHQRPYKCTECNYASVELSKLRRHIIRRHNIGERIYQCPHCTYTSPDTFMFTVHLRTHTSAKSYKCEYCEKCFARPSSLQTHKRIHSESPDDEEKGGPGLQVDLLMNPGSSALEIDRDFRECFGFFDEEQEPEKED